MFLIMLAVLMGLLAGPALAQGQGAGSGSGSGLGQNCISAGMLRVDAAFSRPGSGGTFNYSAQIVNAANRPVRFKITFRMSNAQPNPQNLSMVYTLPPHANQIFMLGSGLDLSTSSRIGGGVLLNCL